MTDQPAVVPVSDQPRAVATLVSAFTDEGSYGPFVATMQRDKSQFAESAGGYKSALVIKVT